MCLDRDWRLLKFAELGACQCRYSYRMRFYRNRGTLNICTWSVCVFPQKYPTHLMKYVTLRVEDVVDLILPRIVGARVPEFVHLS